MPSAITRHLGDMLFETEINGQRVVCDVTPALGGKGRAGTPPDLFVVSIGACVAAFAVNYCEKQGIDTSGMSVETQFEKADNPTHLNDFRIHVRLPNGTCGERLAAVQRVADRCIIQETLSRVKAPEIRVSDRDTLAAEVVAPA
jgi:uncharacterized OsmC-like protein